MSSPRFTTNVNQFIAPLEKAPYRSDSFIDNYTYLMVLLIKGRLNRDTEPTPVLSVAVHRHVRWENPKLISIKYFM